MSDGRLEIRIAFYTDEVHLYRAGALAFFRVLRKTARNQLLAAGAFGPFGLTIVGGDGKLSPHVLRMWEQF